MTINDLNRKYNDLSEDIAALDKIMVAMQADPEIETKINQQVGSNISTFTINGARSTIIEYQDLLKSIMRETSIPWPPTLNVGSK